MKQTPNLNAVAADALAEKIAGYLIRDDDAPNLKGRLVIENSKGMLRGGWSYGALRDALARCLKGEMTR